MKPTKQLTFNECIFLLNHSKDKNVIFNLSFSKSKLLNHVSKCFGDFVFNRSKEFLGEKFLLNGNLENEKLIKIKFGKLLKEIYKEI